MAINKLFQCLFGLLSILLVFCQDCQTVPKLPSFVNVSDNATFHINANNSGFLHRTDVIRNYGSIWTTIFSISFLDPSFSHVYPYDNLYTDRVLSVTGNVSESVYTLFLTLTNIASSDNGTYMIKARYFEEIRTCYILYVLGSPDIEMSVSPTVVEEGSSGYLTCSVKSTTAPFSHNLAMFQSWYINGRHIETADRYRAQDNMLTIHSMTRADDGLIVVCKSREDKGFTTWANLSIEMNWGPDLDPILEPSNPFYYLQTGEAMPDIKCYADCKPACEVSWTKQGNGTVISTNGILSIGTVAKNKSGEYTCTAARQGLYKTSKSIYIIIKEKTESASKNEHTNTAVVNVPATFAFGVVSVLALIVSIGILGFLLRHKLCIGKCRTEMEKKTETVSTIQNRLCMYENLQITGSLQENYDALNLGAVDISEGSLVDEKANGSLVYENNKIES